MFNLEFKQTSKMRHFCDLCSADEEDQPERINRIHDVGDKVDTGHEGDNNQHIPFTETITGVWFGIVLEAVQRPHDHSCDVHQHCQHVADRQDFVERCREERQQAADGENDDKDGKNEADGVNSNTPLEPWVLGVVAVVQTDEDDAGHKGLYNLEEAWDCGKESTDLTRFGPGHPNLTGVQDEGHIGSNSGPNLPAANGASVEAGIDDGCCQYHEGSQHGKSGGEIVPGDGQLCTESGEFQEEDEEGYAEAEAPGEHTPRPEGARYVAH